MNFCLLTAFIGMLKRNKSNEERLKLEILSSMCQNKIGRFQIIYKYTEPQ